jgi:tetratricopeptide (TPR) repeat protein
LAKINPVKVKADADKLEKAGQTDKAIALYKQVVDDNPKDWNTINKIGDLYAKLNKPREASAEFAKVADFYAKDGFLLKAIAIWKKINKLDASAMEPYLNLADLYAKQGLMMEAKGQYQIVVDEYIKRGKNREAGDVLKKLAEIDPTDLKVRSKLADLYTRGGDNKKAVEEHIAIADELNKKGHVAEALQVLEKGLKLDPANTKLKGEVARVHLLQKNYDKAVGFLEQTLQAAPNDKELLGRLGEAYLGAKKVADAESTFRRLLEMDPKDDEARVHLGRVRLFQGDLDAAYDEFLPVVDRLLEKREADKAAALLQQIVQKAPAHVKSLLKLIEIYRFAKNERSVAATYTQLSEAYINDGQLQQAVSVLETLVEREPHNQQHRSKLEFVRKRLAGGEGAAAPPPREERAAPQPELIEEELDLSTTPPAGSVPLGIEEPPARAQAAAPPVAPAAAPPAPASKSGVQISGPLNEEDTEFIEEHLAEGKVFRKYGLVDKAADQFEAILARFSDNVEARQELREVYREKGLNTKAAEQALALAEIFRLQGNEAEGRKSELEARSLDPQLVESRLPAPPAPAAPPPAPPPVAAEAVEVAPEELAFAQEEAALAQEAPVLEEELGLEGEEEISLEEAPEMPPEEIGLEVPEEEPAPKPEAPAEELPPLEEEPAAAAPSAPAAEEIATTDEISMGEEIPMGPAEEAGPPAEEPAPEAPEEVGIGFASEEISLEPPPPEPPAPPPPPPRPVAAPPPVPPPAPPPQVAAPAPLKAAPAPAAYVEETPTARTLAADLQRVLSEVDSYIALGFVDDAKDALREIAGRYPAHPAILAKIDELGMDREEVAEPAAAPAPAARPPAARPPAAVEEEPSFGIAMEEAASEPPAPAFEPLSEPAPMAAAAAPPFESPFEGGIDLGAELDELFGAQSAVEEIPVETTASELGDSGLADIFREFKKGVDKQLGKEDYDTRYNLGIAYKEMGLIDEAIAEFQLAAKDENRVLECGSMLGICFMEKGMPKLAIKWFEKGLKTPGRSEEEYAALRYDLAMAFEASGELDRALDIFSDLYGQDANFRDVAAKVRELRSASR